jgi:iron complex outermembrane receptor protein
MDMMQVSASQNEISMRGFNQRLSNKVLVLVDGRSVFIDYFGGVLWELLSVDVDQVDRIEVVRGPGSALYGADAFAGVVNIITKAPGTGEDKLRVGVGPNGQGYGSFRVAGRDQDLAYRASVGYTRNAAWGRTTPPDRTDLIAYGRDPDLAGENRRFDLRLTHPIGRDYLVGVGGGVADAFSDFYAVGALKEYQLDAKSGDVTAYIQGRNISYRAFYNFIRGRLGQAQNYVGNSLDTTGFSANVLDNELVWTNHFATGAFRHSVNVGANYRLRNASTAYTGGDRTEHHMGVFAQESATYKKWLNLVASGRADYVPYTNKIEISPRLSALVHPTERSTVRAGFSTAFRKPTFLEGYVNLAVQAPLGAVQTNTATQALVDEGAAKRLDVEKILTAEIGYTNQESDVFDVEASVYFNRITDLIQLAPLTLLGPSDPRTGLDPASGRYVVGLSGFVNQCAAFNVMGGELGVRTYPVQGLDVFANYAFNRVAIDRPAGCDQPSDSRTSAHKINAGVQWRTKPGIDGELTFHWVSDQIWSERDIDQKAATLVFKELPLGAYSLVNGRIGWKIHPEVGEISAAVFNAFDDVHREHPFTNQLRRRVTFFFTRDL